MGAGEGRARLPVPLLVLVLPSTWVIAVVFLFGGFGNGLHNVGIRTTIHRCVPRASHASAWSYYSVLVNGCVVTGYLVGTPWGALPAQGLVVLSGALALVVSACAIWRVRRLSDGRSVG